MSIMTPAEVAAERAMQVAEAALRDAHQKLYMADRYREAGEICRALLAVRRARDPQWRNAA